MMSIAKFKKNIIEEWPEFVFLALYLSLFLASLSVYKSLILNEDVFSLFHVTSSIIEALILAKIILLGKMMKLGEKYEDSSLIIPSIYKAFIFSFFVFIFTNSEHFVLGFLEKKQISVIWDHWTAAHIADSLGKLLIAFLFFILLFSFLELVRVFGSKRIFNLFFRRKNTEEKLDD